MSNKKKNQKTENKPLLYSDHKIPTTRREFLSQGLIGLSTMALVPTLGSMIASAAAQDSGCTTPEFFEGMPYLCFDAAGGMNIAGGNIMVGFKRDGLQTDFGSDASDFVALGVSANDHPSRPGMINNQFGLVFHSKSGILQGMKEILDGFTVDGKDISTMIDGLVICTRSSDDTNSNILNTMYQANKVGAKGKLVELIGDRGSDSGGNSVVASSQLDLSKKPSQVRSFANSEGLLSLGPVISRNTFMDIQPGDQVGQERIKFFMKKISNMSKAKLAQFMNIDSNRQIASALDCSISNANQLFQQFSAANLNPFNAAGSMADRQALQTAFGISGQTVADESVASISNLVLSNIAGAGTITLGGADYHDGTANTGHQFDVRLGRYIGKAIKLAALKGKNLFLHVFTDGSVVADRGGSQLTYTGVGPNGQAVVLGEKGIWVSDSGERGAAFVIAYKHNHAGGPLVKDGNRQIGSFVKAGGVDLTSSPVSNNLDNLWKGIMLNYIAVQTSNANDWNGFVQKVGARFEEVFGRGTLPGDWEKLVRFLPFQA